jgi:hypothetical protein
MPVVTAGSDADAAHRVVDGTVGKAMAAHTLMLDSGVLGVLNRPMAPRPDAAPIAVPRTAAGAKAAQRRRARIAGVRRPPSGVLPSSHRTSAVVTADRGDQVADRVFGLGRWGRLVTTVSLVATSVIVGVALLSTGATQRITDVTVGPGDSLWSIARHAEPGADPRSVVEQIKQLNSLDGDAVMIGAVLKVPTVDE